MFFGDIPITLTSQRVFLWQNKMNEVGYNSLVFCRLFGLHPSWEMQTTMSYTKTCLTESPMFDRRMAIGWNCCVNRRTVFNILGPLCNPAGVKRQLMGVFDGALTSKIAKVFVTRHSKLTVDDDLLASRSISVAKKNVKLLDS